VFARVSERESVCIGVCVLCVCAKVSECVCIGPCVLNSVCVY
jgi:hypothetical protein